MQVFISSLMTLIAISFASVCSQEPSSPAAEPATVRLQELDAYWNEVSRAVRQGDFAGYSDTCHEQGVLVSGIKQISQPLSVALSRWKSEFEDTRAGKIRASVEFKFSQRIGGNNTAHETGIFLYSVVDSQGKRSDEYIHFEALLVKEGGKWKSLMEFQKSTATEEQWQALSVK